MNPYLIFMNNIFACFQILCLIWLFSVEAFAYPALPPNHYPAPPPPTRTAVIFNSLGAPKTDKGFAEMLREVFNDFLLLDRKYYATESPFGLFDIPGFSTQEDGRLMHWLKLKKLDHGQKNEIRDWIGNQIFMGYGNEGNMPYSMLAGVGKNPKRSGSLNIYDIKSDGPFSFSVIDFSLFPRENFGEPKKSGEGVRKTKSASAVACLTQRSHPRGCYRYEFVRESASQRSKMTVELHPNGNLASVVIEQDEL